MKKCRYLNRLVIAILLAVLIPVIIITSVLWKHSSKELEKSNEIYYQQIVTSFSDDFMKRLKELKEHAVSIIVDSKQGKSVFHEGVKRAKEHPYWYYTAVQELKEQYSHYDASSFGIYYYDLDRIITDKGSTNKKYYLRALDVNDDDGSTDTFWSMESYRESQWIFGTTVTEENKDGYLIAGYCTRLGKDRDQVLMVYVLGRNDYEEILSTVYGKSGINFWIQDESLEKNYLSIGDCEEAEEKRFYYSEINGLPLSFSIHITDDSLQNNVIEYFDNMKLLLFVMAVVVLLLCLLVIYIVYRPVYQLMTDLKHADEEIDENLDEFGRIRSTLDRHRLKITEQEMLIIDLILNQLLHGGTIPQKRMKRLGVSERVSHYCVFVLKGYVPLASETQQIAEELERLFYTRLFCIDCQGEEECILITFMENAEIGSVEKILREWIKSCTNKGITLIKGIVVNDPDHIRASFLSCMENKKAQVTEAISEKEAISILDTKEEQQQKLKQAVLEYLEIHFCDVDLSQVKVADAFKISNYTLSRLFKTQIGVGFAEYVNSKRLGYAKELLLTTSLTVREISIKAGYTSETYFGRVFKANVGVSPTAFRDQ